MTCGVSRTARPSIRKRPRPPGPTYAATVAVALAHVMAPHYAGGTAVMLEVTVEHRRKKVDAVVRALPFFDPARKRA